MNFPLPNTSTSDATHVLFSTNCNTWPSETTLFTNFLDRTDILVNPRTSKNSNTVPMKNISHSRDFKHIG